METVIRVVVIYVAIMAGLRILGKREFGQLSPLELVTLLLIPEIVSPVLNRENASITNGLVGVTTIFALVFITSLLMHLSKRFETAVAGEPTVLVAHGKLNHERMNKERVTPDEIFAEMHMSGIDKIERVRWAILESDGKISIIAEDGQQHSIAHKQETELVG